MEGMKEGREGGMFEVRIRVKLFYQKWINQENVEFQCQGLLEICDYAFKLVN